MPTKQVRLDQIDSLGWRQMCRSRGIDPWRTGTVFPCSCWGQRINGWKVQRAEADVKATNLGTSVILEDVRSKFRILPHTMESEVDWCYKKSCGVVCDVRALRDVICDVWARLCTWDVSQRKFARCSKTMCFEPFPCTQADVVVKISESSETNPKNISRRRCVWSCLDIIGYLTRFVAMSLFWQSGHRICPCSSMKKQMNWNESMNCPGIRGKTEGKRMEIILGDVFKFPRNHPSKNSRRLPVAKEMF